MELLLAAGVDVNILDGRGSTVLHHAVGDGRMNVVQFLVDHGADVNLANKAGETPLQLAHGNGEMEQMLRKAGAKG